MSRRWILVLVASIAVLAVVWTVHDLQTPATVYGVGDSISAIAHPAIATALAAAGYQPTINAVPGAKLGQAQPLIARLAARQPAAWIIELGSDDAGAGNRAWALPFAAVWDAVSPARCVIYVTLSPRTGPLAAAINAAIAGLARSHPNVHVLPWGTTEYDQPGWVRPDLIHPTPAGAQELASLEVAMLRSSC
ncbi:MAG TPA: GDSL-type esterase/lipase family protein [Acidimicrobiales bacterium]